MKQYFKSNKNLWDRLAEIHHVDPFYEVQDFLNGKSTLKAPELSIIGDPEGTTLLHLQCHFGLDTLSFARMGAEVTGADLSSKAIEIAKKIQKDASLEAQFICSDLYELPKQLHAQFDTVFTSYGAIPWLPDLNAWAQLIHTFLKPGGQFVMAEFHPLLDIFDFDTFEIKYDYFHNGADKPIIESIEKSYTGTDLGQALPEFTWNHHLGEIFQALLSQDLQIQHFAEWDYSPFDCFADMIEIRPGAYRIKFPVSLPHVFTLLAKK